MFSGRLECIDLIVGSAAVIDGNIAFQSITIQRGGVIKGMVFKKE